MKTFLHYIMMTCIVATTSFGSTVQAQKAEVKKAEVKFFKEELAGGFFKSVSSNGKFVVGHIEEAEGYIYDVDNDEIHFIEAPGECFIFNLPKKICTVEDISDNGIVCGNFLSPDAVIEHKNQDGSPMLDENGDPLRSCAVVPGVYKRGNWMELERHDNVPLVGGSTDGSAVGITADGTKIAGLVKVQNPSGSGAPMCVTTVWDVKSGTILKEYAEGCTEGQGGRAWCISDDASLIGGWSAQGAAIWHDETFIKLDKAGEVLGVSPNGKYAVGAMGKIPFMWTEEEIVKYPIPEGMSRGAIVAIADDGTAVGYFQSDLDFQIKRIPFIITKDGNLHDLMEYLKDNYDYTMPSEWIPQGSDEPTAANYMNTPMDISADGTIICGFSNLVEPWIIKLSNPTSIEQGSIANDLKLTIEGKNLFINSEEIITHVALFNLAGQMLVNKEINTNQYSICTETKGTYLLRIISGKGTLITRKVII